MAKMEEPEFWQQGPVPGIGPLLQPVAHALLQSQKEVRLLMEGFPAERLWDRPAGLASPGFHLQHLSGVLDRLFTYARGEALDTRQRSDLAGEGQPIPGMDTIPELLERFSRQVEAALKQLSVTPENSLPEARGVGRAKIPSTVGGLLFHAAEHIQRHTGQLLVTVRVILAGFSGNP
jgi:hypothetical protein